MAVPQSKWPAVIGIIAIVWAALGLLGAIGGLASTGLIDFSGPQMPKGRAAEMLKSWTWMSSVIGLVLGALLLATGIGLLSRRRWSRKTGMAWAITNLPLVLAGTFVTNRMMESTFETMSQDPNLAGMPAGIARASAGLGFAVGICWGWAIPLFLLIWLLRGKIKAEMATWR